MPLNNYQFPNMDDWRNRSINMVADLVPQDTVNPALGIPRHPIDEILQANKDKNFVQRILTPEKFPDLQLGPNEWGTHMMSSANVGGKNIVYPEIIYENGKLRRLGRDEAIDYALKSGEYITANSPEQALYIGQNYKSAWRNHPEERFRMLAPEYQGLR